MFSPANIQPVSLTSASPGSQASTLSATLPNPSTSAPLVPTPTLAQVKRPVLVPTTAVQPNGEITRGFVPVSLNCDPLYHSAAAVTKPSQDQE